ncbi:MAG: UDP-N-acetylmuramoyl-L-alanyl-D-glutamate--2,6-diaminopimelate ligase, partial [Aggregatilineales bacterium]
MPKKLSEHLSYIQSFMVVQSGSDNPLITAPIVEDNREVKSGGIFVARQGLSSDGHRFIPAAIEHGAAAIIGEKPADDLPAMSVPYIQVNQIEQVIGILAAAYYDFPSREFVVIGITGTNGKTTTTHILHSIMTVATGGKAGFISTIGADFGAHSEETGLHVTTPGAPDIQRYLAQMRDAGLTHVILEMTSHGLAQGRLSGVDIDIAIVTNITHEHLDYHGSWEVYRDAKAIMFRMLKSSYHIPGIDKISIRNREDSGSFEYLMAIPANKHLTYGLTQATDYQAENIQYQPAGTYFTVRDDRFHSHLIGKFNLYNLMAAITCAKALNISPEQIQQGLNTVAVISGRMERIDEGQDFTAIVDFAHTPDALEKALNAGRQMLPAGKKLIAVFGSAGLRDVEKRRMMAEVSAQYADITILTAEDPRTESLNAILQMMAEGCIAQGGIEGETFIRVPDRGEALYQACQMATAGDIVMACGKGHEQSMCFGTIEYPWDDRDALRAALRGSPLKILPVSWK